MTPANLPTRDSIFTLARVAALLCAFTCVLAATACSERNSIGDGSGNGDGDGDGDGNGDGDGDGDGSGDGDGDGDGSSGAGGNGGGSGGGAQFVPTFPGAGTSEEANEPLVGGMLCDSVSGDDAPPIPPTTTRCFVSPTDPMTVRATIEQALECVEDANTVRLRLTFDPGFNDNTYGTGSIGWSPVRGHRFRDLVGSDHAELKLVDGNGEVAMQFKLDYISMSDTAASGYAALGVSGGDGSISLGDESHIVAWSTSLDRNLNERGYGSYIVDSPATDEDYTANPDTPEWDYRVVFEVWVDLEAFGDAGFSGAFIDYVHASPAKTEQDTIDIEPGKCPPPPCDEPNGCYPMNPDCPDDPDGDCGNGEPPDPMDPCEDNDPDTFCDEGEPGDPPPEPAYCDMYPTDPTCHVD